MGVPLDFWVKSAEQMASPSKAQSRKETPLSSLKPFSGAHYYTSSIKLFHLNDAGPSLLTGNAFVPLPPGAPIRGFVGKAARILLDRNQDDLASAASVSRKTLFDFEVGDIEPKIALNNRIRKALEDWGASFVVGEGVIGVVVYSRPAA